MKICSANLYFGAASASESPTDYLERMPLLRELPASLASAGHEVDVVQSFPVEASFNAGGVNYHFVRPTPPERGVSRAASWLRGPIGARRAPAVKAIRKALQLQPDVIHFHRLTLSTSLYLLQLMRGKDGPAIVAQHHGGRPVEGLLAPKALSAGLKQVQRVLFARIESAESYLQEGLLVEEQIIEVADRSTTLTMKSRPEARQATGMQGSPIFLWYAGLEPDRDPMTAVLGFEKLLETWPKAHLYLYYNSDELLPQLRAYVIANPALAGHVHFQGREADDGAEQIFNSADFLLQTDRLANNGHAMLEAMACGVIPVASDIPLFRKMIDNGRCGFLFPQGDAEALAKQLGKISPGKIAGRAALVHDWFEAAYSYDAMAGLLLDIYAEAIGERREQLHALEGPVAEGSS